MQRFIIKKLDEWKKSPHRKPLILRGARQVGKTWILKEFGKTFQDGFVYFNFDKDIEYRQFFENTKDTDRIIRNLVLAGGRKITKQTLIIFDEIQECEDALNCLKYFCEDNREYYIVCAGSYLGLELTNGFPVGKVNFLDMKPMTFEEFLVADGESNLYEYLREVSDFSNIPDFFFNKLEESFKLYFITGGMPEAVSAWCKTEDPEVVDSVLSGILDSYRSDFGKHTVSSDIGKVNHIWDSLPSQLSKKNRKFMYSAVKTGARAREYENALNRLCNAGLTDKVFRISKSGIPLSAYRDLSCFKVYFNDVGLLRGMSRLSAGAYSDGLHFFGEFKGAMAENYVLQSLRNQPFSEIAYWTNANYEVDFTVQTDDGKVIPIEVKSGKSVSSVSLKHYLREYEDRTPVAVRFSMKNLSLDGHILNVPLFMADELCRFLKRF